MTNKEAITILVKEVEGIPSDVWDEQSDKFADAVHLAIKALEERPTGKWIGNAFDEHHCSRCGHPALWEEEPDGYYEAQSRFCPTCGADMEGGTE